MQHKRERDDALRVLVHLMARLERGLRAHADLVHDLRRRLLRARHFRHLRPALDRRRHLPQERLLGLPREPRRCRLRTALEHRDGHEREERRRAEPDGRQRRGDDQRDDCDHRQRREPLGDGERGAGGRAARGAQGRRGVRSRARFGARRRERLPALSCVTGAWSSSRKSSLVKFKCCVRVGRGGRLGCIRALDAVE